jgi:hypothetical protein
MICCGQGHDGSIYELVAAALKHGVRARLPAEGQISYDRFEVHAFERHAQ